MKSMLTRAKMRTALLWLPLLFLGQLQQTTALCILEDGSTVYCHDLEDAEYIATYNLTSLTAPVGQSKLTRSLLKNLVGLRNLDLSRGELEEIESGVFKKMDTLRRLNLANNNIKHFKLNDFDGLKNLEALDLRGNALSQLPPALLRLDNLRVLEISGNPLDCNCATLRVRDLLLLRDVKISKSVLCGALSSWRGTTLLELDADIVCMFEEQDNEMQADQPNDSEGSGAEIFEGSGGSGSGDNSDVDIFGFSDDEFSSEYETPAPETVEAETPYPVVLVYEDNLNTEGKTLEGISIGQRILENKDASFNGTSQDQNVKNDVITTNPSIVSITEKEPEIMESFIPVLLAKESSNDSSPNSPAETDTDGKELGENTNSDLSFSGETPEESDSIKISEKSSFDDGFNEEGSGVDLKEDSDTDPFSFWNTVTYLFGESSTETPVDDKGGDESMIRKSSPAVNETISRVITGSDESVPSPAAGSGSSSEAGETSKPTTVSGNSNSESIDMPSNTNDESGKVLPDSDDNKDIGSSTAIDEKTSKETPINNDEAGETSGTTPVSVNSDSKSMQKSNGIIDETENVAPATESKRGMSSYIVLGVLLFILVGLIGFAALKNSFCKKTKKRDDIEGGKELKDMQKSLLDGNKSTQPKISSNGNTENAPLVITPDRAWNEPGNSKPWKDENTPILDEQLKRTAQTLDQEPVKPPRKSLPPQDDPNEVTTDGKPLEPNIYNGVNTPPNSLISEVHVSNSPPLSPNAQRVKITLQDNMDSVPKTPILITRTKAGENLVKTP